MNNLQRGTRVSFPLTPLNTPEAEAGLTQVTLDTVTMVTVDCGTSLLTQDLSAGKSGDTASSEKNRGQS